MRKSKKEIAIFINSPSFYIKKPKVHKADGKHCVVCRNELPKYRRKYCSKQCKEALKGKIVEASETDGIIRIKVE
jgi:hypothetical protein